MQMGFSSNSPHSDACKAPSTLHNILLCVLLLSYSFADRRKDTLKVSGMQVSPSEIEAFLLSPSSSSTCVASLITDVAVAGVITSHSSRTKDELVPRAWVVPSMAGRSLGERELKRRVEMAVKEGLSSYKWLRGGVDIVDEVSAL